MRITGGGSSYNLPNPIGVDKKDKTEGALSGGKEGQTPEEITTIQRLKAIENEVIAHEQAHKSAGGSIAGPASYSYAVGPDGKRYINGGEVSLRTPATDDKQQKIQLLNRVKQAALAPAQPSAQDISVAAGASSEQINLSAEIQRERAAQAYEKSEKSHQAAKEKDQPTENVKHALPGKFIDKVG